ncbi:hypothetical protein [Prevotella sp. HJM029]|uniref:hypothetical protein n=1 Tax=Prevotella sp. HJM029 TaxID=1433844 RepID=UPI0012DEDC0A|nr:hypothetical protein [Prevotella sp. HJM029]
MNGIHGLTSPWPSLSSRPQIALGSRQPPLNDSRPQLLHHQKRLERQNVLLAIRRYQYSH